MYITPDYFFLVLGFALIIIELVILTGLTGGWLLFIGIGALATGFLGVAGLFTSWAAALSIFTVFSIISTLILWKFMRSVPKNNTEEMNMIGAIAEVSEAIAQDKAGKVKWSGVDWHAEIDKDAEKDNFELGQKVVIVATKNITVFVKEVD